MFYLAARLCPRSATVKAGRWAGEGDGSVLISSAHRRTPKDRSAAWDQADAEKVCLSHLSTIAEMMHEWRRETIVPPASW